MAKRKRHPDRFGRRLRRYVYGAAAMRARVYVVIVGAAAAVFAGARALRYGDGRQQAATARAANDQQNGARGRGGCGGGGRRDNDVVAAYGEARPSAGAQRPGPPRRDAPYRRRQESATSRTGRRRRRCVYANYCSDWRDSLRRRADLGPVQNILLTPPPAPSRTPCPRLAVS